MPDQPKTPQWTMRLDKELRARAIAKARAENRSLAEVVREFIEDWVERG
jgi:predicted HicB family RNase H-like nuclease